MWLAQAGNARNLSIDELVDSGHERCKWGFRALGQGMTCSGTIPCRANAVVVKAQKADFGKAAAAVVATTLLAGVRIRQHNDQQLQFRVRSISSSIQQMQVSTQPLNTPFSQECMQLQHASVSAPASHLVATVQRNRRLSLLSFPFLLVQSAQAISYDDLQGLTYLQVKGSGIANTCPVLEGGSTNLRDLKSGSYK